MSKRAGGRRIERTPALTSTFSQPHTPDEDGCGAASVTGGIPEPQRCEDRFGRREG
jgi:hypothetical protein